MQNLVIRKLNDSSGESIAETLVAVLIAAFALLMLAGTINSASNMITKSKATLDEYYKLNNLIERRASGTDAGYSVGSASLTISSSDLSWNDFNKSVSTYTNSKVGSKPVTAYTYVAGSGGEGGEGGAGTG